MIENFNYFRAWHKKDKVMLDVAMIDFASGVIYSLHSDTHYKSSFKDIIIMRCAEGFKDVNGKYFFEGDKIETNLYLSVSGVIKYGNFKSEEDGFYIEEFGFYVLYEDKKIFRLDEHNCYDRIVGNIYE